MSSSLTLIQAISPTLIGLSFLLPFTYGWVKKPWYTALMLGWCLFMLSSLLSPICTRLNQIESITNESTYIIEPSQPNLTLAICIGWMLPLSGYFLGLKLGKLRL